MHMWSHLCVYVCVPFHTDVNQSFSWLLLFTTTQVVPSKLWFSSGFQLLDVVYSEARVNFVLAIFLATLPVLLCQQRIPTANETKTFCIHVNRLHIGAGQDMCIFILFPVDATSQSCQIEPGGCLRPAYLDYTKQAVQFRTMQWPRYVKISKFSSGFWKNHT